MKIKKITKRWAGRQGACEESVERFFELFPDGLDLKDAKQVKRAWRVMSRADLDWFIELVGDLPVDRCYCGKPLNCGLKLVTKRELRSYAKEAGLPL